MKEAQSAMTETNESKRFGLSSLSLWPFLIAAILLRYILVPLQGGFWQDRAIIQEWARTLANHPMRDFYLQSPNPDHLPGDMILLKALQQFYSALGGNAFGEDFDWFSRIIPIASDVGVSVLLASILYKVSKRSLGKLVAIAYLFLPMSFIMSGYWTVYDSLSLLVVMGVARLALNKPSIITSAAMGVICSWGMLIKPQLIVPLTPFVLYYFLRPFKPKLLGVFSLTGVFWAFIVCHLFGLGLLWDGPAGSLLERYGYAADLWPYASNGAFNVWAWTTVDLKDTAVGPLGLQLSTIGIALTLIAITATVGLYLRLSKTVDGFTAVLWASATSYLMVFFFATRMHGRYVLIGFALVMLLAALVKSKRLLVATACLLIAFLVPFATGLSDPWNPWGARVGSLFTLTALALLIHWSMRPDIRVESKEEVSV